MPVTEKTFELNLCTEMVYYFRYKVGRRVLWFGPNLRQEARMGFDVAALGLMAPFFVQFKVGTLRPGGTVARFRVNNNSRHDQHKTLVSLSQVFPVLYGYPMMFGMADIDRNTWQLLAATCWIDVNTMPPLPPPTTDSHSVDVDRGTFSYVIRSNDQGPTGQGMRWEEVVQRSIIPGLHEIEGNRVIELVDEAIHPTGIAEIMQDDIADGLACALVL